VTDSRGLEDTNEIRSLKDEKNLIKNIQIEYDPVLCFRSGIIMGPTQLTKCMAIQKKVISSLARTTIFRYMHGDLTTNEKLFRAGITQTPLCEFCGSYDDYEHRYTTCENNRNLNTLLTSLTESRGSNLNEALSDPLLKPKQLMIIGYLILKIADFKAGKLLPMQHYQNLDKMFNKM